MVSCVDFNVGRVTISLVKVTIRWVYYIGQFYPNRRTGNKLLWFLLLDKQ